MLSQLLRPANRRPVRTAALPVDPRATVHQQPPPLPRPTMVVVLLGSLLFGMSQPLHAVVAPEVKEAREQYKKEKYKEAKEAYTKMLQSKKPPAPLEELYYGLGAAELQLKEYDTSAKAFSDALKSHNRTVQKPALRGLATALYNQGDVLIKSDLEATIKAWTDSRDHFDTALKLEREGTDEHKELTENRALVQKRLDEVKIMLAEQKAKEKEKQKGKKQKQEGEGQGEGDPDEEQEGDGKQPQPQKKDGSGEQEKKQKRTDALQEGQKEILEGELRAGDPGKQPKPGEGEASEADNMRDDRTGYTPLEARSMLRMYSDERKSTQYLMRRERAPGGKDY
jgi:Ca-activated chloride channel family protein